MASTGISGYKVHRDKDGYLIARIPGVGKRREHRVIMESIIGRKLGKHEHVHHRNGTRDDNTPSNLEVVDSNTHMSKFHKGKDSPLHGRKLTEEHKMRIGESQRGSNNHMYGKTGAQNPMFGKTHTQEAKEKMSKKLKGRVVSEETRKKLSKAGKGRPNYFTQGHNKEFRDKMSKRMMSEGNPNYGKPMPEERKKKMILTKAINRIKKNGRSIMSQDAGFTFLRWNNKYGDDARFVVRDNSTGMQSMFTPGRVSDLVWTKVDLANTPELAKWDEFNNHTVDDLNPIAF